MFSSSKAWAVGLLVAIGVAGFASGAVTMNYVDSDRAEKAERRDGRRRCSYSGMLQEELGLSDAQRDSVRAILRRHRPEMNSLFETIRPQMDSIRAQIRVEMMAVLTPEQQEAYRAYQERQRERTERRLRRDSTGETEEENRR
jgi:Spy/CpxP family protein refolding chaperone